MCLTAEGSETVHIDNFPTRITIRFSRELKVHVLTPASRKPDSLQLPKGFRVPTPARSTAVPARKPKMSTSPHFEDDAFISYGHIDNQHVEDEKGWIDNLHERLERRLGELLGHPPKIWRDPRLPGNVYFADVLGDRLGKTSVLVSVLSPGYLQSPWCMGELKEFCRLAELSGGLKVGERLRIFKVVKTYIERD